MNKRVAKSGVAKGKRHPMEGENLPIRNSTAEFLAFARENGADTIVAQPKNEIVVYQPNETMRLEVSLRNESAWLPQQRIADLFGVQKAAISKHLKNIFASGELDRAATVSKMETVQTEGA